MRVSKLSTLSYYQFNGSTSKELNVRRMDVSFPSGNSRCEAWFYLPDTAATAPRPCVVVAHGIGAIRQVRLAAYAARFTKAGLAVVTFDYRHWGASMGAPRFLCSISKQHEDINAAIDFAQHQPDIDPSQIFLFGTSFGGGHALAVGAQRPDLAGVISQCTVSDCLAVARRASLRQVVRWVSAGMVDQTRALLGLSPRYIKLAGNPGESALMTELDAEMRYKAMLDEPSPWRNLIAARLMLWLPLYRPIKYAASIESPLLMVVCDRDEICPASYAVRAAELAPRGRAVHFDSSHFEIYFGELFERAVSAMLQFLTETTLRPQESAP